MEGTLTLTSALTRRAEGTLTPTLLPLSHNQRTLSLSTLSMKVTFSQCSRSERRTEFYKIVISGSPTAHTLVFRIFTLVRSHFQGGCRQLFFRRLALFRAALEP